MWINFALNSQWKSELAREWTIIEFNCKQREASRVLEQGGRVKCSGNWVMDSPDTLPKALVRPNRAPRPLVISACYLFEGFFSCSCQPRTAHCPLPALAVYLPKSDPEQPSYSLIRTAAMGHLFKRFSPLWGYRLCCRLPRLETQRSR